MDTSHYFDPSPERADTSSVLFRPSRDGSLIPCSAAFRLMRDPGPDGDAFRTSFVASLRHGLDHFSSSAKSDAEIYLECRPTSRRNRGTDPFEFRVVRALDLSSAARRPDPSDFAEHIEGTREKFVPFANLGRDALLIAPSPPADPAARYGTLAGFLRTSPKEDALEIWKAVGSAIEDCSADPLWVSTSGAGVPWLHVRLDSRPKYYKTREYMEYRAPGGQR
ncbi:hypothetical protein DFJ74DRAFT_661650 [Hyaloraphidium curvatum]|nr:hypothetical protein DFJ74DRAFT_661650 [Hyaloraphidium curvatum]